MPLYRYEGMNSGGKIVSGQMEASTESDAQNQLRSEGLFVTQLRKVGSEGAGGEESASTHVAGHSRGCFSASVVLFLLLLLSVGVGLLAD